MRKFILLLPVIGLLSLAMGWNMSNVAVLGAAKPKAAGGGGGGGAPGFKTMLYADSVLTDTTDTRTFTNSASAGECVVLITSQPGSSQEVTNVTDSAGNTYTYDGRYQNSYTTFRMFHSVISSPIVASSTTFTLTQSNLVYAYTDCAVFSLTNATTFDGMTNSTTGFNSQVTSTNTTTAAAASVGFVITETSSPTATSWGALSQITGRNDFFGSTNTPAAGAIPFTVQMGGNYRIESFWGSFK